MNVFGIIKSAFLKPEPAAPEPVLTPEEVERARKLAFRETKAREYVKAIRVGLVRDKATGLPKFDGDPRLLPDDLKAAYRPLMTPEEYQEIFG
jgi:hypothetical protein